MMKSIAIISFLLLVGSYGFGQISRRIPKVLIQTISDSIDYENQGRYHSTHLFLHKDSSFLFYSVYEVGYILSLGSYSKDEQLIILNWNQKKTFEAISDTTIYHKYFKHSTPQAFPLKDIAYEIRNDTLILTTR